MNSVRAWVHIAIFSVSCVMSELERGRLVNMGFVGQLMFLHSVGMFFSFSVKLFATLISCQCVSGLVIHDSVGFVD